MVSISMLSTLSCERFFDPDISNTLAEKDAYNEALSSRAAVNGLYSLAQDLMTSYVILGELRADMLQITPDAGQDLQDIFNLVQNPDNALLLQLKAYHLIANCNDVIYHLEEVMKSPVSYEKDLNNMFAEAVTMRSWTFFYLLRTFGSVPYLTGEYAAEGSRQSIDAWLEDNATGLVTVAQLIADTEEILSDFNPSAISATQYFNLASANALLGEMHLWENQYEEAVESLLASVRTSSNRFILDSDLQTTKWANIFKGDETANDEIMTKILFNKTEKQENDLVPVFSGVSPNTRQLQPTAAILTAITGTHRFAGTFKNSAEVGKYTRTATNPYLSDMPVILYRAADVHLMLAEAYANMGEIKIALDLLNNGSDSLFTPASMGIRGRLSLSSVALTGTSAQDSIVKMENLIITERGREMAFEGKRYFDLLRIAKRRNNPDFLSDHVMLRFADPDTLFIRTFFNNPANWYLPFE
jgi:tetratricopeptide (TPR) repeat protein